MNFEENRKWAILSQITYVGWIIAAIATKKKEKNNFLCRYLNNGLIFFVYGLVIGILHMGLDTFEKFFTIPGGATAVAITELIFFVLDFISLILNIIFLTMLVCGIVYAVRGENRCIPYLFKIKAFEKVKVFKADINEHDDTESKSVNLDYDLNSELSNTVNIVSAEKETKICPHCKKAIPIADVFCTFCGEKTEISSEGNVIKKDSEEDNDRLTVADYIKNLKDYKCENCGEIVSGNDKFCPSCGKQIIIKIMPSTCSNCGKVLQEKYTFCPDCGTEIQPMELQTKCTKCGADLLFGKDFCVNCGAKVDDGEH